MSIINANSFTPNATQQYKTITEGTVEVTLHNETRRVEATKQNGQLTAYGMTGRYQTGGKAWPASVTQKVDPTTNKIWDSVSFGRDDRHGKFQKTSSLHFA